MIPRLRRLAELERVLAHNPVCARLGPRQCGKTTLALEFVRDRHPAHVIDEIQRQPRLFEVLMPIGDIEDHLGFLRGL